MKHIVYLTLALTAAFALQASVISIELGAGTALGSTDVAGVVAESNWTQASASPAPFTVNNLVDDSGTNTGASISVATGQFSSNRTTRVGISGGDLNTTMFNRGGGIQSAGGSDIVLSSLPSTGAWSSGYDVYVYFAPADSDSNPSRTLDISIGSTTYYADLNTAVNNYSGSFDLVDSTNISSRQSGNYAKFSGVTGSGFTLNLTSNVANTLAATGMQIVAIPEPGTLFLTLVAGLGIFMGLRRRR